MRIDFSAPHKVYFTLVNPNARLLIGVVVLGLLALDLPSVLTEEGRRETEERLPSLPGGKQVERFFLEVGQSLDGRGLTTS
jgi:hypothetical protein